MIKISLHRLPEATLRKHFFINPTTPEDVEPEITTLKNNNVSGPGSIRTKVFKTFAKPLSKPLADLINLSFSRGKFPSLKKAKVIPVFKKGDKLDSNKYRPISLISNISKDHRKTNAQQTLLISWAKQCTFQPAIWF